MARSTITAFLGMATLLVTGICSAQQISVNSLHRSKFVQLSTNGSVCQAATLTKGFVKAFWRSVNRGGSRLLSGKELSFISSLSSTAHTARLGASNVDEIATLLTRIQRLQNKGQKKKPNQLAFIIGSLKDKARSMSVYEGKLSAGYEETRLGHDNSNTEWLLQRPLRKINGPMNNDFSLR